MIYFYYYFIIFVNIAASSLVIATFYTADDRVSLSNRFLGSNLFGDGKFVKKCFSVDDVALLSARSKFEALIPNFTSFSNDLENDKSVGQMLEYLQGISGLMNAVSNRNVQYITQAAYYDVVGGYLNFFYSPFVKFSFYAGTLTYKNALRVFDLQNKCKQIINTHGNGWRLPTFKFLKLKYKIQPISINTKGLQSDTKNTFKDPCGNLILSSEEDYNSDYADRELVVSLPRIESIHNDNLISVWMPFKNKRNFILNSKSSAFVLTKYYVDVLKCYQFRNANSNPFNRRFRKLLYEKVLPLIHSDEFYPGFGAILRVWETLKGNNVYVRSTYKFDTEDDGENEIWDETANLADEAESQFKFVNKSDEAKSVNETNFFLNMVDSIKGFEMEWNQKQKTKYICLAIIVAVIGFLLIILCIFVSRERQKKNVNQSTLTRERENNWKTLLRKLSSKSDKTGLGSKISSEFDFKISKYEDTTSLVSESAERRETPARLKRTDSEIKSMDNLNVTNARLKKVKRKTLRNEDYSSSSSSSSLSTKSKRRRIYRKIYYEIKQSRFGDQNRPRSIHSKLDYMPSKLKTGTNFEKFKESHKTRDYWRQSLDSELDRNSSGWETLPSSKVLGYIRK